MSSQATHITVTLSRELTWAEREGLSEELLIYEVEEVILGHSVKKIDGKAKVINLYSMNVSSRSLFDMIHFILSTEFVNVYVKSVQTIYPKVKV